jgi:acyl-[acyl-carrier-protein]-phospholipid O-acyltransferase/long-chain-fatty-acid--[acyl-carrier-protein] ligase
VWGSIFSFAHGRFYWKLPRRLHHPVTVHYGAPLTATATHLEVRQAVQDLQAKAWQQRRRSMKLLHRTFINTARHHPRRVAMADATVPSLTFAAALMRTIFLARRLRPVWRGQEMVGLLLPPSVPGALVNWAALLLGNVPVNLNYTVSEETLASCVRQCGLRTVLTSRKFLEKVKLPLPCQTVMLEELAAQPRFGEKLFALLGTWLLPAPLLEKALGRERRSSIDDLATVIFSSGSTGEPKGVMLTHYNVASNVEQVGQVFGLGRQDRLLGILPFFHSFGFTGTLCLPGALGVGVVYHPNPLEAAAIGELVREHAVTFLLGTPTFLQLYLRGCEAEDFGSLRLVMAGAEKLPERIAEAFEEKFGVRPVEGYGCTECAPVVTVNTHDYRAAGFRQVGAKRGKIGHPLPGLTVRIVDPDTREPRPVGTPGLLLVRGPNVMTGYLGRADKTAEVLRDGWYVTGDIATLDEDGFLQITDRLSRFSKIGGEMVPHIKVEEKLHELAGCTEQCFVVTGVPDEKKGERLAVLHTLPDERLKVCLEKLPQAGLPNLWAPRPNQFFRVETLPYLGTGKLDLRKVRELALELSGGS